MCHTCPGIWCLFARAMSYWPFFADENMLLRVKCRAFFRFYRVITACCLGPTPPIPGHAAFPGALAFLGGIMDRSVCSCETDSPCPPVGCQRGASPPGPRCWRSVTGRRGSAAARSDRRTSRSHRRRGVLPSASCWHCSRRSRTRCRAGSTCPGGRIPGWCPHRAL